MIFKLFLSLHHNYIINNNNNLQSFHSTVIFKLNLASSALQKFICKICQYRNGVFSNFYNRLQTLEHKIHFLVLVIWKAFYVMIFLIQLLPLGFDHKYEHKNSQQDLTSFSWRWSSCCLLISSIWAGVMPFQRSVMTLWGPNALWAMAGFSVRTSPNTWLAISVMLSSCSCCFFNRSLSSLSLA